MKPRRQIEYIDIDLIDEDPRNVIYSLSDLDDLAANIELFGLQQPLLVRANPDAADRVIVCSGHRRRAALRKLVGDGREDLRDVPCIREVEAGSEALQELRLIFGNKNNRALTSAEISKQAQRVELLLYQLKEEGYEFPGRMRDHVAEACNVSRTKLARLKVIRENLQPDFLEAFNADKLPEQTAYTLAQLPEDFQRRLFRIAPIKEFNGNRVERVKRLYEAGARWDPDMACPDGKPCKHGDAALRHDLEVYDPCKGATCCLTCHRATRDWSPCERMCSKAKAQRKANEAAADAKSAAEQKKARRKEEREAQKNCARLVPLLDAAGISDSTNVVWSCYDCGGERASVIRDYAEGRFPESGWISNTFSPSRISGGNAAKLAKMLGCSTDYLLGLTDNLAPGKDAPPAEGWIPLKYINGMEKPKEGQTAVCLFKVPGLDKPMRKISQYKAGCWTFPHGAKIDAECIGWFPIPEEE